MSKFNTAEEVLAAWDKGDSVFTIEMGGMGPGYEQAIQVAGFETLREIIGMKPDVDLLMADKGVGPAKDYKDKFHEDLRGKMYANTAINKLGLSGAQAGAAMNLAYMFYNHGHEKAINLAPEDRRILASKNFPGAA